MNNETIRNLEQYIDHDVVEQSGTKIGTLSCLWSDESGEPLYLGVQTGWLFGKTHVVPADSVELNEARRTIRLPYTAEEIKEAPSYDKNVELDETAQDAISAYYESSSPSPTVSSEPPSQDRGEGRETGSVRLHEEELIVGKRQVEAGGVRLRKIVRTETVNQPVELKHEEIVIERVPGGGQGGGSQPGDKAFQGEEVYVPLRREEAVVQKESRVREEVRVSKKSQTERQTVSGEVRKEDVEIEEQGKSRLPGGQPGAREKTERYEPKERSRK